MLKKKFSYDLNYFQNFSGSAQKQSMDTPQQNKVVLLISKSLVKVAGTMIALRLPSFTKKGASGIKQEKWAPLLNSAYSI